MRIIKPPLSYSIKSIYNMGKGDKINIEKAIHKNLEVIKLLFSYDTRLMVRVRQLPGIRWSQTMHCWYVPNIPLCVKALSDFGIQIPDELSLEKEIKPTGNKRKEESKSLLLRFASYMKEQRYSERTIEAYTECLQIFFNYCNSKSYLEINNKDIDDFNKNYILKRRLSATYQSQFVNAIKLFYKKIPQTQIFLDRIERPRRGRPLPKVISKEDVARIINSTNNLKHRTMLSFLYSCGLRRSELLEMRITDIDSKRNIVNIRHAKGDKDRQVPLSPKILELLREYFKQYRPITWLFEGDEPNTPYAAESLQKVFVMAKKKAGIIVPFKLHGLRHCYATHLMEAGIGLRYIQELLGHRHIKTTEIYLHVSSESISKIQSPFDTLEL